ncbi:MAG: efflux RND transporter periplasmic adaptor subunit [Bacteroidales bacterium]|jgi:membrane fusion protein (multidrug efflux system)|nr:efflux RND transporter periplasmic adaptor subunit [Bacteroidales bacterium]
MKKGTKIALWTSIPLVLLIWFAGPRLGLWGNRDLKKKGEVPAAQVQAPGQAPGGQQGQTQGGQQGQTQGGQQGQRPGGQGQLPVTGTIAKPSYLTNGIRSAGSLLANEEVDIVGKVSGKVTAVYFKEGSKVKKGDLLVKIYDEDLQAQLRRSEIQEKMLSEKLERQRVLLSKDAVSREAFDQLQTDYNVILADINLLKVRIAETEVRAPFDGVIGFRYVSEGTYVTPQVKIAHLFDQSILKLEFAINEKYVSENLMGKKISFETEGYSDEFFATVYAVDYRIDQTTRTIGLRARYDNRTGKLVPGMYASLTLITDEKMNALQVPTEAIVPEMNEKKIWVARNGRAELIPVVTGARTASAIEVISGLAAGDTVLTTGLIQLRPNMAVRVNITD